MPNMIVEHHYYATEESTVQTSVYDNVPVTGTPKAIATFDVEDVSQLCLMGIYTGAQAGTFELQFSPDGVVWFTKPSTKKEEGGLWSTNPMVWQIPPGSFCIETPVCAKQCRVVATGDSTITLHVAAGRM